MPCERCGKKSYKITLTGRDGKPVGFTASRSSITITKGNLLNRGTHGILVIKLWKNGKEVDKYKIIDYDDSIWRGGYGLPRDPDKALSQMYRKGILKEMVKKGSVFEAFSGEMDKKYIVGALERVGLKEKDVNVELLKTLR